MSSHMFTGTCLSTQKIANTSMPIATIQAAHEIQRSRVAFALASGSGVHTGSSPSCSPAFPRA
jgi:hypothetical protein